VASPVRRVLACLALLLIAHLNLVAGDFACSTDHQQSAQAATEAASAGGHRHDDGGESSGAEECKTPVRAKCCEALASCTITIVFARSVAEVPLTGASSRITPDPTRPLSLFSSPDTPPPKT
jgi:hypothetical protein